MCGVFAIVTTNTDAGDVVLDGLKKLEYRGYDSWGIAVRSANGALETSKGIGKISTVTKHFPNSSLAIGHTRWATHGGVAKKNAHPHTQGRVTVVHNGIAENYIELKKNLPKRYTLVSETDSEILAALIDSLLPMHPDPREALRVAASRIEGRYALVVHIKDIEGLWIIRRGSPLIFGKGTRALYVASDIPAFLEHTHVVNYLDDDELAHMTATTINVYNILSGDPVAKRDVTVTWTHE